ncbi:penicillin-binding protein 2, partial [Patescibacteria group bacterium]|nr:penicillin-binding protein 2 [Patescibacteria group bacterium]
LLNKDFKNRKIRRTGNEIQPEEILWDTLAKKKEDIFGKKMEIPIRRWPLKLLFALFSILIVCVSIRIFIFQVFEFEKYSVLAERNKFVSTQLKSERGVIYDKNLNQLVFNKPAFNLIFNKYESIEQGFDERLNKLKWILGTTEDQLREKVSSNTLIAENLSYEQLILFESFSDEFPGFYIENASVREYQTGPIFSHIIGYHRKTSQDAGLEAFYNEELSSKPGEIRYERNIYGEIIGQELIREPGSGDSLVLWLDSKLQEKLYNVFLEELSAVGVKKASAIAIDPKTGGVLAMVSFPSYDNNLFTQGISQEDWDKLSNDKNMPFLNRVIAGRYPTGSIIKPLMASAALNEGVITEKTTINCSGEIVIENPWFEDQPWTFKDFRTHGLTNVEKAIAESCNVFFYTIGGGYKNFKGMGPDSMIEYLTEFGWDSKLGIDLPGEISGFIPNKEWKKEKFSSPDNLWMPGDTYNLSIGQGYLSVTPLEVASAFVSLVNGGKLLKPQLVKQVIDKDKNVITEFQPEVLSEGFIDAQNLEIVKKGMKGTVDYGSAVVLNSLPVQAGAKTGTAEIGKDEYFHSWLTVFAPYDDPEIVITLMVESAYGMHKAVAPTALRVLDWYFGGEEIPMDEDLLN